MPAKRYYIITEVNLRDLEERVNVAIDGDGAIPVGGIWSSWELGRRFRLRGDRYGWPFRLGRVFHQAMLDFPDSGEPPLKQED